VVKILRPSRQSGSQAECDVLGKKFGKRPTGRGRSGLLAAAMGWGICRAL
jgi:hypothetical protein